MSRLCTNYTLGMKVIGYARLSAASEESTSIARQHEIIERHAAARGWELVGIVDDPIASASKLRLNRPGLTAVREAIAARRVDAVVVWRLDRIARSVVDFGTLLDEGVSIVSATEPLDTTSPMGRAMAEILQVFAAMEARATSIRVAGSVDYLRRNDRFPGGITPYGYKSIPHPRGVGRALAIDPAAATIVEEVAERVLAGESLYSIRNDLTARGVPTAKGGRWSVQVLRGILIGDAILGRVTTRGELVRDEHGLPRTVWPAILDADTAARLRAKLVSVPHAPRRKASRLLSGLAFCASCGATLVVQRRESRGKEPGDATGYRCGSKTNGLPCEQSVTILAAPFEEYVVDYFLKSFGRLPVVEHIEHAPENVELATVEQQLQETAQALTAPGADVLDLVTRLTALRARRESLEALPVETTTRTVETGRTFAEEWAAREGDLTAQRALLSLGLSHVVVGPLRRRGDLSDRVELVPVSVGEDYDAE